MTSQTQKAVLFNEHNSPLLHTSIPIPAPGPNEILVNIKYTGVCHSDLHAYKGDWSEETALPLIGGHEGVGYISRLGLLVQGFNIGDKVGIKWINKTCTHCEFCVMGDETCCTEQDISGYTVPGTFQEYCVVDSLHAVKIRPETEMSHVAPLLCAGLTSYKALKKCGLKPGQWCVMIGAGGGLGSYGVQYAKAMGIRVIGIDSGDKKEMCLELGVEEFIDFREVADIIGTVMKITDGGSHGVINFSVSLQALNQGIKYVRSLGTIVMVGMPTGVAKVDVYEQIVKQFSLKASSVGTRYDMIEALGFYERGLIKSHITVMGLSELKKVYEMMEKNEIYGRVVLDTSR